MPTVWYLHCKLVETYGIELQTYVVACHTTLFEKRFKNALALDGKSVLQVPWVVGARGVVHEQSLHDTLKFLNKPHK